MDRSHFLGWHEKFRPLGLPLRLRGALEISDAKAKSAARRVRDFETRDFTDDLTPAVAPAVAPSARPVGEPFKIGDRVRVINKALTCSFGKEGLIVDSSPIGGWHVRLGAQEWSQFMRAQSIELAPAQREPHSAPMVRQPEFKIGDRVLNGGNERELLKRHVACSDPSKPAWTFTNGFWDWEAGLTLIGEPS